MPRTRALITFIMVAGLTLLVYALVSPHVQGLIHPLIGMAAITCVIVGVRRHRPPVAIAWYLVATGLGLLVTGDSVVALASLEAPGGGLIRFIDVFYLSGNVVIIVAASQFVRSRSPYRDIGSVIDSAILATTAMFIAWVFYIRPYVLDETLPILQRAVAVAYPGLSLLMFTVAARLILTRGSRAPSFVLLLAAMGSSLVGDAVYSELILLDAYSPGHPIDLAFVLWFIFWAAAALHPTMAAVTTSDMPAFRTSSRRLAFLVGTVLLVPATAMAQLARGGSVNTPALVTFSTILFLLVFWRMRNSVRLSERAFAERQQTLDRERVFHEVASGLAASSTQNEAFETVTTSLRSISEGQLSVHIALVEGDSGTIVNNCDDCDARLMGATFTLQPHDETVDRASRIAQAIRGGIPLLNQRSHHEIHVVNPEDDRTVVLILMGSPQACAALSDLLRGIGNQLVQAVERISLAEDISRRKNQDVFHSLVRNSTDVTIIIEPQGTMRYVSPASTAALGLTPESLLGRTLEDIVHPDDVDSIVAFMRDVRRQPGPTQTTEFRLHNVGEAVRHMEAVANNLLHDPDVAGLVLNVHDITVRKRNEALLEYQAFHDAMTSMPNRALFLDRLAQAMKRAIPHDEPLAVLFLNVDRLKSINDTMGHDGGDALLIMVSQRIQQSVTPQETVARLGGDEFSVLLNSIEHAADPAGVAERLVARLAEPFIIKGREVAVTVSIGVAVAGPQHGSSDALLRDADTAMYHAKSRGRNGFVVFDPEMGRSIERRVALEQDLRRALVNEEFVLKYQPEIDLETGRIVWFEALLRWNHPQRGQLSPLEFVPMAEESGMILSLGRWVVQEACRQIQEWRNQFPDHPFGVSVNLSTRQLPDPGLIHEIRDCLEDSGLPPAFLRMEVTETAVMQEMEVSLGTLNALRRLGIKLAIDDFGHGYSSLGYLRYFPLDVLKLDRSFLGDGAEADHGDAIIQAVITLAHSLGVRVTVEGIETHEQLQRMVAVDCDLGQGFLFSRPADVTEVPALLARASLHASDPAQRSIAIP